jgi:hypothetical protein
MGTLLERYVSFPMFMLPALHNDDPTLSASALFASLSPEVGHDFRRLELKQINMIGQAIHTFLMNLVFRSTGE